MTVWDLGDRVALRHQVHDADGVLTDATVTLTVIAPDGTIATPAATRTSLGTYDASVLANQTGQWRIIWTVGGAVAEDVVTDTFDVADPAPLLYCPLYAFKVALGIDPDDTSRDDELVEKLDVASRGIEQHTNRPQFWLDRVPSIRIYRVRDRVTCDGDDHILEVDDIGSVVGLVVETGSSAAGWTALTDFDTGPDNALARRRPIESLRRCSSWGRHQVRVTARWGWPAIPAAVRQAAQLQASRLNKRKDSPEGFVGSTEWGPVRLSRLDPDVASLVEKLVRYTVG